MQHLLPSPGHDTEHDLDVADDAPPDALDDGGLSDDDLLHAYAYPDHPWLRANMVASADGFATVDGLSEGLSGPVDKRVFGLLRVLADVVLVGAGTARAERYRGARVAERFADLRASLGQLPQPPIAIVSRHLTFDLEAPVFTDTVVRPVVVTCAAAPAAQLSRVAGVADVVVAGDEVVDLADARSQLAGRGLRRMLCEGGPTLLGDLVSAGALDELCLTVSPLLVGGGERRVVHDGAAAAPAALRLVGVLEQDGILLNRYLVEH